MWSYESKFYKVSLPQRSEVERNEDEVDDLKAALSRSEERVRSLSSENHGYKKWAKKEFKNLRREGAEEAIESLFPVLDDIEAARMAGALEEGEPFTAIADKLEDTLQRRYGVEWFGEVGDIFDPTFHDGISAVQDSEIQTPTVFEIIQSGVKIGDKVVRAAKVVVRIPIEKEE